jgi:hypothetical protein
MVQPNHLPDCYWRIFQMMDREGTLTDERRRFFEDVRLKNFWKKVGIFTDRLDLGFDRSNVAGTLTGSFFISIAFFGQTGSTDNPSPSKQVVKTQKDVDGLLSEALKHTSKLIDILEKIQNKSPYYPDEIESVTVGNIEIATESFLIKLSHGLADYPSYKDLFADNKGLIGSQSDTWMDWFHAVNDNLKRTERMYNGTLSLTLFDWTNLYCIFFEPDLEFTTARDRIKKSISPHLTT